MKNIILGILSEFVGFKETDIQSFEYSDLVARYGEEFDQHLILPTFVYGHPASDTPLCKLRADGKCDRFEFFINGYEVANAYNELTDYKEQSIRLEGKNDVGLCAAMKCGMPPTGGMGIGIDRLVMALSKTDNIADVILFPSKRN